MKQESRVFPKPPSAFTASVVAEVWQSLYEILGQALGRKWAPACFRRELVFFELKYDNAGPALVYRPPPNNQSGRNLDVTCKQF